MTIINTTGKHDTEGTVVIKLTYDTPNDTHARIAIVETDRHFNLTNEYIEYAKHVIKDALNLTEVIFSNPMVINSDDLTLISYQ